jgi:ubiquinone/menaquinone biosynthesis C-methylase UbiE
VLDLGAGTGLFSVAIAQWFGTEVVAVEPSEGMLRQARTRAHPQVTYIGGLGEQLPLRDGCCDSAWLSTVIHHLSDLAACAGELRRVVRPGGWVLIRNAFPDAEFFKGLEALERAAAAETTPTPVIRRLDLVLQAPR